MQLMVLFWIFITLLVLVSLLVFIGKKMRKKLSAQERKFWLIAHVLCVIVYFSGLLGQLLLAILTTTITDQEYINAALIYIELFDNYLIVPGAFTTLATGIWLAVRTSWGFSSHYWIIYKWAGNIVGILLGSYIIGGLVHHSFPRVIAANIHPLQNPIFLESQETLFIGIAICMALLTSLVIISYLKPWGKRKVYQNATALKY